MNICLVSKQYPPEDKGSGIATYTYNLAHGLVGLGHNVHVLSFAQGSDNDYMDEGIYIHRVSIREIKGMWRLKEILPVEDILYSIRVAQKLRKLFAEYKIDIVEFPNWGAEGLWFSLIGKKIPVVTRLHTPNFVMIQNKDGKIFTSDRISCMLEKFAVFKSNILTSSTFIHKENTAKIYNIDPDKIRVVPLGIDLDDICGLSTDASSNGKSFNILYVSRLEKRKGIEVLFEAMAELINKHPKIHLHLLGKDTDRVYENSFKERYGDAYITNVHFLGYKDKDELREYYKRCDLLVLPSLYESFGLVYLEAMKYAKPVIGCKVGGVPEVVSDGKDGILIPPNNETFLSEAIEYLFLNRKLAKNMGEKGFQKAKNRFTVEKMSRETCRLYEEIITTRTQKRG